MYRLAGYQPSVGTFMAPAPASHADQSEPGYRCPIPVTVLEVQNGWPGGGKPNSCSWRGEARGTKRYQAGS
jgi:hypothetical protein